MNEPDALGTDSLGVDHYRTVTQRDNGTFLVDVELKRRVMTEYDAMPEPPPPAPGPPAAEPVPRPAPQSEPARRTLWLLRHVADAVREGHYHTALRDRLVAALRAEGLDAAADAFAGLPERSDFGVRSGWAEAALEHWIDCRARGCPVPRL